MPLRTGPEEAHRDQDEVGVHGELGAGNGFELWRRTNADGMELFHVAIVVAGEFVVAMLQSRMPPSSCAASVRSCMGQSGHGVCGERSSGGMGMISNWWTDSGFCR